MMLLSVACKHLEKFCPFSVTQNGEVFYFLWEKKDLVALITFVIVTKHYPHHLSYIHINLWMYEITIYSIQMSINLSYYFSYNLECNLKQYSKSNKNLTENKYFKYSLPQKISCFTIYRQSFITWSIYGEYSSLPKVVNVYDLLLIGYLLLPNHPPHTD